MGVETLPNGDIIVSGTANRYGHDAVILKLNSNGDSLWCKSYDYHPDNWDCQLNDLIVTDDGGFMGVGFFSDHNTGWTAWMFKTDANGTVGWESEKAKGKSKKYKVYPNPSNGIINIDFENTDGIKRISIYNTLGQLIENKAINTHLTHYSFNLNENPKGLYFIGIETNNAILFKKVILE
jgi:hypothetical protein